MKDISTIRIEEIEKKLTEKLMKYSQKTDIM